MKRLFMLMLTLCLCISLTAMAEEDETKRYILLENPVEAGETPTYRGRTATGAETITVGFPQEGELVPGTADAALCGHDYRRALAPKRLEWRNASWPVMVNGFHQQYACYDVVCLLCGDKVEGLIAQTEPFCHENKEVASIHIGQEQHLNIYLCQVCGQYSGDVFDCASLEELYGPGACYYRWMIENVPTDK